MRGLALLAMLPLAAHAADAEYCRPFATHTAQLIVNYAWTRAYSVCGNTDEDPILPETWQGAATIVFPGFQILPEIRPVLAGSIPASGPIDVPPDPPPVPVPVPVAVGKSDLSAAYAKCAATHPRGWDAATHTVTKLTGGKWIRVPCP